MIGRPDSLAGGPGKGWLTGFERSTMGERLAAAGIPVVADPRPDQRLLPAERQHRVRAPRHPGAHPLVVRHARRLPYPGRRGRPDRRRPPRGPGPGHGPGRAPARGRRPAGVEAGGKAVTRGSLTRDLRSSDHDAPCPLPHPDAQLALVGAQARVRRLVERQRARGSARRWRTTRCSPSRRSSSSPSAVAGLVFGRRGGARRDRGPDPGAGGPARRRGGAGDARGRGDSRRRASSPRSIGPVTAFLGATGAFIELQTALNAIWRVKPRPGVSVKAFLLQRLISFGLVVGVGFLLLVSLLVSAGSSALNRYLGTSVPALTAVWEASNVLVSLGVVTLLFAMVYKVLPDVRLALARRVGRRAGDGGVLQHRQAAHRPLPRHQHAWPRATGRRGRSWCC